MADDNDSGSPGFSLFPFLSVLCCVIGVMSLMIISQVIEFAMAASASEKASEEAGMAEMDIDELRRRRDAFKEKLKRLPQVRGLDMRAKKANEDLDKAGVQKRHLEKRIKDAKPILVRLKHSAKSIHRTGVVVELVPDTGGRVVRKRPVVVECVRKRLRLHSLWRLDPPPVPGLRIRGMRYISEDEYKTLLKKIDSRKEYLLFIVRQSGIGIYNKARKWLVKAKRKDINLGVEPLENDLYADVPLVVEN